MSKRNDNAAAVAVAEERVDDLQKRRDGYALELGRIERELTPTGDVDEIERALRARSARREALRLTIGQLDEDIAHAGAELQRCRAALALERYGEHIQELKHELEAAVDALDGAAGAFARAAAAGHDATAQERIFGDATTFNPYTGITTYAGELTSAGERWRRWLDARIASNEYWR